MTVKGFVHLHKLKIESAKLSPLGKLAATKCRAEGITPGEIKDTRYGSVKTYPLGVLEGLLPEFVARSSNATAN